MAALFRKRQFKPWISSIIISKTRNFKPKVVKVLCRRSQSVPGSRVMLVSDGELSISAVFSDEAIHNALSDMDIESSNSNWNTALLILQEFTLELKVQPDMDMGDYVLHVARFNIWDLQPGYQAKYDLKYCMKDEQISERMKEEMKEKKESAACQSEFSMSSSIALSQLLEEMAKPSTSLSESEDSPEQGKACTTDLTDKRSMSECTCGPVTDSLVEKLLQPFTVEEFLIPAAQANVLDNIEEWKTDYQPSPSEDSGESPADGQFDVCALNTLSQDHAVVLTDRNKEKTGSKEAKTDVEYLGISFVSSPENIEEKASVDRKSPGPVCALFKHMDADSQSQGASSQWQEEVESVRFSFEEDSCALSSQESPEEACRPICKESQIVNVTKEYVESKSTSLGENSNKHVVKNCPSIEICVEKNPQQMCMKSKKVTLIETKDVEIAKESPKEDSDLLNSRTSPELDWPKEVNVCKPASAESASEESGKFMFSKISSREICAVNSDCLDIGPPAAQSTQIDDTVDDTSRPLQGSVKGGVEELLDNTEQNENVAVVVNETNDLQHQSSSHNSEQTESSDLVSPVLIYLESSKNDTQLPLVINPKTKVKTESFNQTHETIYALEQNSDQSSSEADRSAMHSYYSQDYTSPDRNWNNVMIRLSKKKKQLEALKYITERISGVFNESKKSDGSEKLDSHDNSLNIQVETSKENGHSDSAIIGKISENLESMDHEESGKSVEIQDDEITKEADDIAETCSENFEGVETTEEETASFCYVVQDAECDSESANKLTEINEEENTQLDTVETTETGYPVSSLSLRETLEECHSCLLPSDTVLNETNLEEIDRFHCKRIAEHTDLGAMEECDQNSDQTDLEEIDKAYQRCINAGDEQKTMLSSEVNTSKQEDKTGHPLAPEYFDTESGSRKRSERLYAKVISCREKDKQIHGKDMIETVSPVLQNIGNKSDVKKNKINAESEIEKHKGPVLVDSGSTFCVETVLDINVADAESTELTSEVDVDQNAKELPGENLIAKVHDESSRDATKSTNGLTINDLDGKKNLENKKAGTLKSVESCCKVPEHRKLVDFTNVRSGKVTRQRTVPVCEDLNSKLNKKVCNNFKEIESRVCSQKSNDTGNFPSAKELNGCDKRGAHPTNNRLPAVRMLLRKIFKDKCSVLPDGTGRYKTRSKIVNNSKSESVGSKVAKIDELTAKVTESKHGTEIVIDSDTDSSDTAMVTKSKSITEIVSDSSAKDSNTVNTSGIMNDEKMIEKQKDALSDGKKRPERTVLSDFVNSESRKESIMLRTDCEPEMKTTVVEGKADETDEHQHENGNSAAVTRIKLKKYFAPYMFEDQFKTWLRKDETENEKYMHTSRSELDSHTESGMQCVMVTKDEEKANCKESSLLENVHLDTSENTKLTDTNDKSESDISNTFKDLQNEVSMEQCDKGVMSCPIQSTQAFDVCPYPQTQEFSPKMSDTQLQTSLNESILAHNVSSHVDKSPEGLDTVSCSEERNSSDAKVTENTSKLQNHLIKDSQGNDKSQGNPVKDSVCEKRKDSADKFLSVPVETGQAHEKENVCESVSNVGNKVSSLHLLVNVMSPNLQIEEGSELRVSKPVHNSSESDSLLKSASEKQFTKLIGKSDHIKISDDFWAITKPEKLNLKVKPVQRKDIKRKRKINDNIVDETNNRKKQKCIEKESLGGLNNRNTQKINQEVEAVELKVVKEGKEISESLNDSVCLDKTEKPIKTYEPRKIFIDGNNFGNKVFWQNFVEAPYTASKQISSETKNKSCVEKTNKRKLSLDSSQGSQGKDSSYRHCKTSKDADNGKVYRSSESLFSEENETLDTNSESVSLLKCKKTETKELGINSSLRKVTYQVKHKVTVNTHNKQEDKRIGNGELRYFKADGLTRSYRAKDKTDTQSKGPVVSTEHSARKETPQLHRMNKGNSSAKTSLPVCRASQNEQNRNSNKVEVNKQALVNTEQDSSRRSQERITEKSASFRNKVLPNSKSKMTCVDKQLFIQDWLMKHKKIEEESSLEPSPPDICSPENSLPSYQTGGITREHNVHHKGQTGENTSMLNDEEQEGEDNSSDNTSTSETTSSSSSESEDPDKPMSAAAKYLLKLKRARKERKTRELLAFKSGVRTQAENYLKSCGRI